MQTADVVALYGAMLSTTLALTQGISAWRGRTKLAVTVEFVHSAGPSKYGTPVQVKRDKDILDESVAAQLTIRNLGGVPVQALGVVVESTDYESALRVTYQIAPEGFPVVLEPGTTVEGVLQKEHFDMSEECTFIGLVDGTGRRHGVPRKDAARFLTECWRLPTRVNVFRRHDDPSEQVTAFQSAQQARLTTRRVSGRRKRLMSDVIAKRPKPLIATLLDGDQVRVAATSDEST